MMTWFQMAGSTVACVLVAQALLFNSGPLLVAGLVVFIGTWIREAPNL